jgi:hypothetical protein
MSGTSHNENNSANRQSRHRILAIEYPMVTMPSETTPVSAPQRISDSSESGYFPIGKHESIHHKGTNQLGYEDSDSSGGYIYTSSYNGFADITTFKADFIANIYDTILDTNQKRQLVRRARMYRDQQEQQEQMRREREESYGAHQTPQRSRNRNEILPFPSTNRQIGQQSSSHNRRQLLPSAHRQIGQQNQGNPESALLDAENEDLDQPPGFSMSAALRYAFAVGRDHLSATLSGYAAQISPLDQSTWSELLKHATIFYAISLLYCTHRTMLLWSVIIVYSGIGVFEYCSGGEDPLLPANCRTAIGGLFFQKIVIFLAYVYKLYVDPHDIDINKHIWSYSRPQVVKLYASLTSISVTYLIFSAISFAARTQKTTAHIAVSTSMVVATLVAIARAFFSLLSFF